MSLPSVKKAPPTHRGRKRKCKPQRTRQGAGYKCTRSEFLPEFLRLHAPHPRHVEPEKYGGVLTYAAEYPQRHTGEVPKRTRRDVPFFKYSNGGCSGFEPDLLTRGAGIYSVYNFSSRTFLQLFNSPLSIS